MHIVILDVDVDVIVIAVLDAEADADSATTLIPGENKAEGKDTVLDAMPKWLFEARQLFEKAANFL